MQTKDDPHLKDEFVSGSEVQAKNNELITELQDELSKIKDKRLEERFLWILGFVILIDLWFFPTMSTWGGPISVFLLELMLLLVVARKWGIEDVDRLVDVILSAISKNNSK